MLLNRFGMMIFSFIILVTALVYWLSHPSPPETLGKAPDLAMPIYKGKPPVHLTDLKGKVVLLDFWATWCQPCRLSMHDLEKLYEQHKDDGLVVIGISTDTHIPDTRKDVPGMLKDYGITYPMAFADDIYDLRAKYEFNSIPLLFIIDKKGEIRERISGYNPSDVDQQQMETRIIELLKEK